ncbi:topoisomerase II-associated protein PAT1-domain-containing protein [Gamsiella multidivaricata]|uniref:topoisomerase II-associated protein PAT1-domain-containing protein n=1 Tax=Gamsiella multidivaricata TaxID=101098 RepID=UPI00222040DA|nr:topoisomerase II-associated protein PAT1-domain-containing protein [Gamsiella multidivaricata]KAI7818802.1 topoisomerase II-associated protein PAT1-domain-containing protein [Gamsiella multidivaricata]
MSNFFGFDTVMPGRQGGKIALNLEEQQELDRQVQKYALETGEDFEIYDYGETYDNLADGLEETRDNLNSETFGTDFDFASNTRQIAPALKKEEELYIKQNEHAGARRSSFASLWGNDGSAQQDSFKMGLPEPSHAASSIWGPFSNTSAKGMDLGGRNAGFAHDPVFGVGTFALSRPSAFGGNQPSLEEIEAQLLRTAGTQPQLQMHQERKMMSLEEVEAALMNINGGRPIYSEAMIAEQEAKRARVEKRRAERLAKQAETAKHNGLMTQSDKDFINRIQISQLVTDDPYADDFYCQVYTALRNRHLQQMGIPGNVMNSGSAPSDNRHRGNDRTEHRMQLQVQRIVSDAKRNPKRTNVTVEGALGKIAVNSVLNPRQLLQVSKRGSTNDVSAGNSPKPPSPGSVSTKSHTVLGWIENVYTYVLALEQKRRQLPPPPRLGEEELAREAIQRWSEEYGELARKMWNELRITVPIGKVHPHPFISILNYSKGKKVIPRVLRHLLPEQTLTLLTMLVANFESLNVCKSEVYADVQGNQEIELFMNTIVPPLLGFVSEAPFRIVVGLLALFIERNNMIWVARSKPGLAFLTLFLSRAEILKQGHGNYPIPDEREIQQWNELYNRLFSQLQTHFSALFMPTATMAEDVHVWRFLAAMAVGASVEQQHVLVTEVREQVLENVVAAKTSRSTPEKAAQRIANVNLFLHALGLDASQVSVPAM